MRPEVFALLSMLAILRLRPAEAEPSSKGAAARSLWEYETRHNQGHVGRHRRPEPILLEHVEIPLDMLGGDGIDVSPGFDLRTRASLFVKRGGKTYVRWILHPLDTRYTEELLRYLATKGLHPEIRRYFTGYPTASRTYIVKDPRSEHIFFVKASTDTVASGAWHKKPVSVAEARDARLVSDILVEENRKEPFRHLKFFEEPAAFMLPELNQGLIIRDMGDMKSDHPRFHYVPVFSLLDDEVGVEIARRNHVSDPHAFWKEHLMKAAGQAMGELLARTGMSFDSPHGQNFLIELDGEMKPTGRVVIRDLADMHLYKSIFRALGREHILAKYSDQKNGIVDLGRPGFFVDARFEPFKTGGRGKPFPAWYAENDQRANNEWTRAFYDGYVSSFARTAGFDLRAYAAAQEQDILEQGGGYLYTNRQFKAERDARWDGYYKRLKDGAANWRNSSRRTERIGRPARAHAR